MFMNPIWPKPVAKSLPDQVFELIIKRITTGELATGHRLPSQCKLAKSMGVGLAVVRKAAKRLEPLHILGAAHGSRTVVRPCRRMPRLHDPLLYLLALKRIGIRDLWETRRLLKGKIVRLAAERTTDVNLKEIRAVVGRAVPLPLEYRVRQELNRDFHIALAKASKNAVFIDFLTPLVDVRIEGIAHHFTDDMSRRTWAAHAAIYRAVAKRDVVAAEAAMLKHFTVGPIAIEANTTDNSKLARSRKQAARLRARRSQARS